MDLRSPLLSGNESGGGLMIKGSQSIQFEKAPYLMSSGSIVGRKEGEGPLGKLFDRVGEDDLFGEETWEAAESAMQKEACLLALRKIHVTPEEVRYLYGGDLLTTSFRFHLTMDTLAVQLYTSHYLGVFGTCTR